MYRPDQRPLGVTIIAILTGIGGILFISSGFVLLLVGIGIVSLALGIAFLVVAYGLWKGSEWAWTITLVLSVIGIIFALIELVSNPGAIINVIIHGVVIYYLYRPNVKAYFGK